LTAADVTLTAPAVIAVCERTRLPVASAARGSRIDTGPAAPAASAD
jgi:hypothetical protein